MFAFLLPKRTSFFDAFDKQAAIIAQSSQELLAMISTGIDIEKRAKRIAFLEKEADLVAHQTIQTLHKSFITPFEREDIYKLISQLDDIIDTIEEIAARIALYKIDTMTQEAKNLAILVSTAAQEVQKAVQNLKNLKDIDAVRQMFVHIHDCEHEADSILRNTLAKLFEEEKDPISLIKWKEIYEFLEAVTDRCQNVASTIEGIIIEQM